jgi:hypothetical protein
MREGGRRRTQKDYYHWIRWLAQILYIHLSEKRFAHNIRCHFRRPWPPTMFAPRRAAPAWNPPRAAPAPLATRRPRTATTLTFSLSPTATAVTRELPSPLLFGLLIARVELARLPRMLLVSALAVACCLAQLAAPDTNGLYEPCSSAWIRRGDGFTFGAAFVGLNSSG